MKNNIYRTVKMSKSNRDIILDLSTNSLITTLRRYMQRKTKNDQKNDPSLHG
jgi:hypothetical protein